MPRAKKDQFPAETCKACKFYQGEAREYAGFCRRYPPKQFIEPEATEENSAIFSFPIVDEKDWCGEFKPSN